MDVVVETEVLAASSELIKQCFICCKQDMRMPGNYDSDVETLSLLISPPGLVAVEPDTDFPLPSKLATVPSESIVKFACADNKQVHVCACVYEHKLALTHCCSVTAD